MAEKNNFPVAHVIMYGLDGTQLTFKINVSAYSVCADADGFVQGKFEISGIF